jgi:predicted glutamine amidotransferase
MCRILYLLNQPYAKTKITHFLMHSNTAPVALDGYGLAILNPTTKRWQITKTYLSPQNDRDMTSKVIEFAAYPLIIGHIRNANILNVPKSVLNNRLSARHENTHPFYYKNHVFLHNGRIEDAHQSKHLQWFEANTLPEYWSQRKGNTDSECLFYLLLSIIHKREWLYKDIDLLEKHGCHSPDKREELKDAVQECFRLLYQQFHVFVANFIYANKEYSIVGRIKKNATTEDIANNPLYMYSVETKKRIMFCTETIDENMVLMDWGTICIIHNVDSNHHMYDIHMSGH